MTAVLNELPGLRLNPDAPPPRYEGLIVRCYKPLNVLFETI